MEKDQSTFYDGVEAARRQGFAAPHVHNCRAGHLTRIWAAMRHQHHNAMISAGIQSRIEALHERWAKSVGGGSFLELGCGAGSLFTMELVQLAGRYEGVDLSRSAVASLNEKLVARDLSQKACALPGDFLKIDRLATYDLVYARGVLHHFKDADALFDKIAKVLRPHGLLLFADPITVNPVYRAIRAAYRPFQSDAAWEFPFSWHTIQALERRFEQLDGFGYGKFSLPLSILTGLPLLGGWLEAVHARQVTREASRGWHRGVWYRLECGGCLSRKITLLLISFQLCRSRTSLGRKRSGFLDEASSCMSA